MRVTRFSERGAQAITPCLYYVITGVFTPLWSRKGRA